MTSSRGPALAAPRLLALRVQGFKSFAERTSVEFGGMTGGNPRAP